MQETIKTMDKLIKEENSLKKEQNTEALSCSFEETATNLFKKMKEELPLNETFSINDLEELSSIYSAKDGSIEESFNEKETQEMLDYLVKKKLLEYDKNNETYLINPESYYFAEQEMEGNDDNTNY